MIVTARSQSGLQLQKSRDMQEGTDATCDFQDGILTINLKTLNINFEINCD